MVWKAGLTYFAVVFGAAFVLGVCRVLLVAPRIGEFAAVALEVPLVLALSWVVAGRVLQRWPMGFGARIGMGGLAFALLMLTELALATLAFGQTPQAYVAKMALPPGLLGLLGQIGFGLIPALRRGGR